MLAKYGDEPGYAHFLFLMYQSRLTPPVPHVSEGWTSCGPRKWLVLDETHRPPLQLSASKS